jgi:hypothetical protein
VTGKAPGTLWRDVRLEAAALARRIHYLGWSDRTAVIDEFLWTRARTTLSSEQVTAIINRIASGERRDASALAYAAYCGAVVSGALAVLRDATPIRCDAQALVLLATDREDLRTAALDWLERDAGGALAAVIAGRPGHAFLLLSRTASDTAQSFVARDAFFAAMLGRQ